MAKIFKASRPRKPGQKQHKAQSQPSQLRELVIERLADDGRGVAYHDGKVVFVEKALAGERVMARWQRSHKRYDEAIGVEWLERSAQRQPAVCQHADQCGGCQLQHVNADTQREYKQARLQSLLQHCGSELLPRLLSGSALAYRHRARLSYRAGHLGFREAASHRLIDLEQCPVLEPVLESAVIRYRGALLQALKGVKEAELHVACDDDGRTGVSIDLKQAFKAEWCEDIKKALAPLELHGVSTPSQQWSGGFPALRYGGESGLRFVPRDFTQANRHLNSAMLEQVLEWLSPQTGEQIVDYFCGLGNFSLPLAARGAQVLALDAGETMLARARELAASRGLPVEFAQADLFEPGNIALRRAAKVLLDPPRAGAKAVCEALVGAGFVQSVVYVSCDPASLARDLAILVDGGFQLRDAVAADMFPQTHHLESMIWLTRPSSE